VYKRFALLLIVLLLAPASAALAFNNTEPDAAQQWYLTQDNAWTHWPSMPHLKPVRVAVIDSGIDATHPDLRGRIAGGISFVGGSWRKDSCGHGTFIAGEIAANPTNDVGIAGMAFNASLLIAKVVDGSCNVSTSGEVKAIRWAVDHGARVINLSIGGIRDPGDLDLDSYSASEEAAIEYAWSKGVLVVAAVGNGTQAPSTPWQFADYPAALPHVLGVGAIRENGAVPDYSDRDPQYVDLVAPGGPIFSTIPRNLVDASIYGCAGMPYSNCGPSEFRAGIGTSFSAPQVAAAAALMLGIDPALTPSQIEWILERTATDASPSTGCAPCPIGRDALTGWGTLDVAAALNRIGDEQDLPTADAYEPNDDAGTLAYPLRGIRKVNATIDFWDDPIDVYAITLKRGQTLFARLGAGAPPRTSLFLWRPGTTHITGPARTVLANRAARGTATSGQERLAYHATANGTYYVEVEAGAPTKAPGRYSLSLALQSS
jgi:Subtilase family